MHEAMSVPMLDPAPDLVSAVALSAAGIAAAILVVGVFVVAILTNAVHQLQRIGDQLQGLQDKGVDINVEAGATGRSPFDADQLVRGAGFLITLLRQCVQKNGEAIPSAERLTLDLGKAMGVPLPVREQATAVGPGGVTVQSGLLPYGAKSIPARLDPETA